MQIYSFCSLWISLKHSSSLLPLSFVLRTPLSVEIKITFLCEHKSRERIPVMLPEEPAVLLAPLDRVLAVPQTLKGVIRYNSWVSNALHNIPTKTTNLTSTRNKATLLSFCYTLWKKPIFQVNILGYWLGSCHTL